ncbi:MAG: hypothetical protein K2H21_02695 [Muribaculaceae bacterium]|nr:hypothetical protein [Muribaculaceae bacterium]
MKKHVQQIPAPAEPTDPVTPRRRERSFARRLLSAIGIVAGVLVLLVVVLLTALTFYLNPDHLSSLINREGSRYLNADISVSGADYTLWSSFPRLRITTDSITVRSRTLDSLPAAQRRQLPHDADFLGCASGFAGSINVIDLLLNRYVLQNVRLDGLRVNLVALNDSVNNFSILPTSGQTLHRVPYFSVRQVSLRHPGELSYLSVAGDSHATVRLDTMRLSHTAGLPDRDNRADRNIYKLAIGGCLTASSAGLQVLRDFPFSLDGDLRLRFDPFGLSLSDYAIDLGEIHSHLSMSVGMGDDPRLESFDYRISSVNLMNLLGYIPHEYLPALQGIKADMPISASARLLSAWSFASDTFPSVEVDFRIPEGDIDYTVSTGRRGRLHQYALRHSPMEGRFIFDGERPDSSYIAIPPFSVSTSGVRATVEARIDHLVADPLITAGVTASGSVGALMRLIPVSHGVRASGRFSSDIDLRFTMSQFSAAALSRGVLDIHSRGTLDVSDFRLSIPSDSINLRAAGIHAVMGESAKGVSPGSLDAPCSSVTLDINRASADIPQGTVATGRLRLQATACTAADITPESLRRGFPVSMMLQADTVGYASADSAMRVAATGLSIQDATGRATAAGMRRLLSDGLTVSASTLAIAGGNGSYTIDAPRLALSVSQLPAEAITPIAGKRQDMPDITDTLQSIPAHTPALLRPAIPPAVAAIFNRYDFRADLQAARCSLGGKAFADSDYIADIDLSLDPDRLNLRDMEITLSGTPGRLSGTVGNLRSFLTLPSSEDNPLLIDLTATIPRIDINALSHAYVEGAGGEKALRARPTSSPSDTVAMLIPRNIRASLTARVGEADYTNLDLTGIVAEIGVERGVLDVRRLGIGASFGQAEASFLYDTSDLQRMRLGADLHFEQIDIVRFFDKFHSLLEMMPQMRNLSGLLSINGTLGCHLFPTMYLDIPSARADLNLQGRELKVHQSDFIRRITRMMLIRTDNDIHIEDIDVQACVHDNLLQLYPFDFSFDRYRLRMLGVNNFNGLLYYHIAVEKSPVPIAFGINIEGMFHDPRLRFGGSRYNDKKAEEVTSQIINGDRVNLMHVLRGFLREFLCTGARYHATASSPAGSAGSAQPSRTTGDSQGTGSPELVADR